MGVYLVILVSATVAFAGVITYALARRYGWKPALILPVLAMATSFAMLWQREGTSLQDGLGLAVPALVFSAPTLAGALIGLLIARLRRP